MRSLYISVIVLVGAVFSGCSNLQRDALTSQEIENGRAVAFLACATSGDFKSAPIPVPERDLPGPEDNGGDVPAPPGAVAPSVGMPAPIETPQQQPAIRQPQRVLMFYTAKWCVWCPKMKSRLMYAANASGIKVADYNSHERGVGVWIVDTGITPSKREIAAYPTVLYLEDGIEKKRWVGIQTLETCYDMVEMVR